jgi:hypothetical protein
MDRAGTGDDQQAWIISENDFPDGLAALQDKCGIGLGARQAFEKIERRKKWNIRTNMDIADRLHDFWLIYGFFIG